MTIRIGFIGYGFMGKTHANALARLPMFFPETPPFKRQVLIGRDEQRLATAADRLEFQETATDWRVALDDIDVLYNLGPNHLHAEPSIEALERDIHVLCEKPLAHTLEAAERMAAAARSSDAIASVAFNYRFVPAIVHAKELIDDGQFGDIRGFRGKYLQDWLVDPEAAWTWRNSKDLAGSGALGDLGAHVIDLARYLLGQHAGAGPITSVSGYQQTYVGERPVDGSDDVRAVTVDDAYAGTLEFDGGAVGTLEASRVAPGHKNDLTIAVEGATGGFRFSLERLNELSVCRQQDRGFELLLITDESDPYLKAWWPPGHVLGWEHAVVHENYEFLRAVSTGLAPDILPSFEDGLAVQRTIDAFIKSAEQGTTTSISDAP